MENNECVGNIQISEDVVARIASIAALEIEGVACLEKNLLEEIIERIKSKTSVYGVKIDFNIDSIIIDIYLVFNYGTVFRNVAANVHRSVKAAVESMTNYLVDCVNVHVVGVKFPVKAE